MRAPLPITDRTTTFGEELTRFSFWRITKEVPFDRHGEIEKIIVSVKVWNFGGMRDL
jgi:hypothetical protein